MSKIDICISIIQTIKDYLFSTEKLKNHHEGAPGGQVPLTKCEQKFK